MLELEGRTAIVTGGASGIGRASALALGKAGANVVVADLAAAQGDDVVATIQAVGARAIFVPTDVTDDGQVDAMVAAAVEEFGGLDIAFNNAGIPGLVGRTHECSPANWDRVLAVNLTGVWTCMRHELPRMLERGAGVIVNTASVAGHVAGAGLPAYAATKHAVIGLTRTAAVEYARRGIRVNAVCPGVTDTPLLERLDGEQPQVRSALLAATPAGRVARPSEIADAVVWLCSDRSSYVTGQAIAVDGGFLAQ